MPLVCRPTLRSGRGGRGAGAGDTDDGKEGTSSSASDVRADVVLLWAVSRYGVLPVVSWPLTPSPLWPSLILSFSPSPFFHTPTSPPCCPVSGSFLFLSFFF